MPFVTCFRLPYSHLLAVLVVVASLTSGCQSSRPAFTFQPAPGRGRAVAVAPTATTAAPDSAGAAGTKAAPATGPVAHPLLVRVGHRVQRLVPAAAARRLPTVPAGATATPPATARRRGLLRRPHATAEVGLGTTVFGILGLIMLPIAALGLILTGGALGWIIVAGLAALAVLVAYIDPYGR